MSSDANKAAEKAWDEWYMTTNDSYEGHASFVVGHINGQIAALRAAADAQEASYGYATGDVRWLRERAEQIEKAQEPTP